MGIDNVEKTRNKKIIFFKKNIKKWRLYYLMFIPVFVMYFIFKYIPMVGIRYAFYNLTPFKKEFVGLKNFKDILFGIESPRFWNAFKNTVYLSLWNIVLSIIVSVIFALLLNEITNKKFKKSVQTIAYLPHFLSWVVTASIFSIILSPQIGFINGILEYFGKEPIFFLADEKWWVPTFLFIYRWKETGWGTIIYLAALTSIDIQLYEAAEIDGAGKLKQAIYITIPLLVPTILLVFVLELAKILNIFESVFVFYNPMVHEVADVIELFVYRKGMQQAEYGLATAIGLFKSLFSMILVLATNKVSKKIKGSGIL